MATSKYLDYFGLEYFWEKVQSYIDDADDALSSQLTTSSSDSSITVTVDDITGTDIVVNIDDSTIKQDDYNQLYVVNALSDTEKGWIEEQLFDSLMVVTISRTSPTTSYVIFSGSSVTVTWTLTATYDGTLVDLDTVPTNWTWTATGTYTYSTTISSTTGSSVSSGSVTCYYTPSSTQFSKTASSVSYTNVKYSYIYCTTDESLSSLDDIDFDTDATMMNTSTTSNTISGSKDITFTAGQYAYFIVANTSSLSSVTQLGLTWINSGYTSMTRTNYGTYKVYRSINSMSAGTQSVTVA